MSFLDSVKSGLSTAAAATKLAASAVAAKTQATYAEMRAPPTEVQCSGCPLRVPVPHELQQAHAAQAQQASAAGANAPVTAQPTVQCAACQAVTPIPSSKASMHLKNSVSTTKSFVANAATATKAQINYLKSAPEVFHCMHCNALLGVPQGAWACQTCTAENEESAAKCVKCTQKKSEQKCICGVCTQSTVIPSSNFVDGIRSTKQDVTNSSKKLFYDAKGVSYVTCSKCNAHCKLPEQSAAAGQAPSADGSTPEGMQSSSVVNSQVVCASCNNTIISVQPAHHQQQQQPHSNIGGQTSSSSAA